MELTNFDTFDSKETHLGYLVKKCRISIDLDRAFRLMSEHAHTVRLCHLAPILSRSGEKDSYKFDAKSAWFETWIPCKLHSLGAISFQKALTSFTLFFQISYPSQNKASLNRAKKSSMSSILDSFAMVLI